MAKGRNRNDRRMMVRQTATKGPWEHWWYAIMYKPILFLSLFHFVILYFTLTNTNLKPSNFHSNRNLYFDNIGSNIVTPFYSKNLYCNNTWQGDEYKLSLFYKMTENPSTKCMRIIHFIWISQNKGLKKTKICFKRIISSFYNTFLHSDNCINDLKGAESIYLLFSKRICRIQFQVANYNH